MGSDVSGIPELLKEVTSNFEESKNYDYSLLSEKRRIILEL